MVDATKNVRNLKIIRDGLEDPEAKEQIKAIMPDQRQVLKRAQVNDHSMFLFL